MSKESWIASVLAMLFLQLANAQESYTVSGIVKDQSNGETVIGANVYLKELNTGTTTNEYGFYSISAEAGTYTLVVSYLGYAPSERPLSLTKNQSIEIEIKESAAKLDEVVVVADDVRKVNIKDPQMGVTTLKSDVIKKIPVVLGEVDVIKSIQLLPGVTSNGEGSAGFNVRGGAADQNLVLLDEAIIYNTSHLFGFFSVFNADAVKDVKLYKGDIPARFGGRISSVLDVHQRDGNSKQFGLRGGIGLISSRLAVEGPLFDSKGSFLVAGRTSYAHLFMPLIESVKNSKLSFYDLNLKANYRLDNKNKIYLSGYLGRDVFKFDNAFDNNYGNISGNLRWNHTFNNRLFSNLSLIYSKYDYQFIINFSKLDWIANIENFNGKYDMRYYVNDNFKLSFGVSSILHRLNPGEVKPTSSDSPINYLKLGQQRALESALYVAAEHEVTDKLTLSYGLRYSNFNRLGGQSIASYENNQPVVYNEELGIYERGIEVSRTEYSKSDVIKTFGNLEPRLGLSYQLTDESSIKASFTRNAQYMHLLSNTQSVTPLDVWTPSGTYIKPQLSNQYALGYYRNYGGKYSLEIEGYYKKVDNRIDYIDGSDLIGNENIEREVLSGDARAYGMELLIKKNSGRVTGWLAYTISKSEQRALGGSAGGPGINDGKWYNAAYDRTHDISLTGSYKWNDKWSFGANFAFQTGRPVTNPNGQYDYLGETYASYSARNADRLPVYHRLDISATLTPNKHPERRWQGEWVFGVYNLYGRKNAASMSFETQNHPNEATQTSIFGAPIPSITYNFKF